MHFTVDQFLAVILFIVGSFLTWFVTYVYFKKAEKTKRLCFSWSRDRLFSYDREKFGALELKITDIVATDPYKITLFIWNSGNETINGSDISKHDPLRFGSTDIYIMKVDSLLSTREALNFKYVVGEDKSFLTFDFDFLDNNDGASLEILYDQKGKSWPSLTGTVKGVKGAPFFAPFRRRSAGVFSRYISGPSFALFMLACAALSFYDVWIAGFFAFTSIAKILAGIIFTLGGIVALAMSWEGFGEPKQFAVPAGLLQKSGDELFDNELDELRKQNLITQHRIKSALQE